MEILPDDVANNNSVAEGVGSSVIVREKGHYFGKCIYFDPPDLAPVGMDNKVIDKWGWVIAFKEYCCDIKGESWTEYKTQR